MKKIIAFFCLCIILVSIVACGGRDKDPAVDLIDFEAGKLNIDTSEIVSYVKKNGYEDVSFSFDVDKQIYSCEVHLSEAESSKIVIDGYGYENFISSARTFLIAGTRVMEGVLTKNGLSGISCGMVLAGNDELLYCVALDGVVTFVAHTNNETISVEEIENKIAQIVNATLNDDVEVTINNGENRIDVFYKSSTQTQESVRAAFDKVMAYMNENGFSNYILSIFGHDGHPYVTSESQVNQEGDSVDEPVFDNIEYSCVGKTPSNRYVFEVISTPQDAALDGERAATKLSEIVSDKKFIFYVLDETGVFLGDGNKDGYKPFVYSKDYDSFNSPSFTIPFDYYLYKYFGEIAHNGYRFADIADNGAGVAEYIFAINDVDFEKAAEAKVALQTIADLMSQSLGENVKITVQAFAGTPDEIYAEAFMPPAETDELS